MTTSAPSRPLKRALLIGCALAALGGMAGTANAQAFSATPTTAFGSVTYNRATPGVETVTINSNTAVIDWRPTAPPTFLPAGNVATFTNGVNNADFVVLNRILSAVPMRFDGTVLSQLVNGAGGTTTGGTVIFSSPGGLIVGATGVFDVGSLVLTTLNVDVDAGGNFYDAGTRGITLSSPPSPIGSPAVVTQAGAQLRALQPNSYIALIGPVVQHGGSTRVNGSAAYVAGEQVTFRANQGLFDIIVDTGSDVAIPLTHTGSTGGPANVAAGDNHAIYLVAMPKNQAITAVLQGDIGFDPAVTAGVENGVIVLSAGANIDDGVVDRYGGLTGTPAPDQAANFEIIGGVVRSDLIGVARTNIRARPIGTPTLTFQQDVSLFGGSLASISVSTNQTVTVLGNALVSAAAFNTLTPAQLNLTGGQARIFTSDGGTIHIFGTATVDASARGLPGNAGTPGTGTGGSADVNAGAGGTITIDGALTILARGEGGISPDPPQIDGAAGTGGSAVLTALAGGTVTANGTVTMDATGVASFSGLGATRNAAVGTGGVAQVLAASGGTIVIAQAFNATADGFGGFQSDFGSNFAGGNGTGGGVGIGAGAGTVTFNGSVNLSASGSGGAGPTEVGARAAASSSRRRSARSTSTAAPPAPPAAAAAIRSAQAYRAAPGRAGRSASAQRPGPAHRASPAAPSACRRRVRAASAVARPRPGRRAAMAAPASAAASPCLANRAMAWSISARCSSRPTARAAPADLRTRIPAAVLAARAPAARWCSAPRRRPTSRRRPAARGSRPPISARGALAAPAASAPGPAASAPAAPPRSRRSARRSP